MSCDSLSYSLFAVINIKLTRAT